MSTSDVTWTWLFAGELLDRDDCCRLMQTACLPALFPEPTIYSGRERWHLTAVREWMTRYRT